MRIAYCGYDFFSACLRQLLGADHHVVQVFTFDCDNRFDFNQYLFEIAEQYQLPITTRPIDKAAIANLEDQNCDLVICAGYRYKVPELHATQMKGINVHPTLLPLGRGVWPLPWTILTQQTHSGISIHKLTPQFDAGDLLLQKRFELSPGENLESLSAKAQLLAKISLLEVVNEFDHYWSHAAPQTGTGSYWRMPDAEQRRLDWNSGVENIDRTCRAFGKYGSLGRFDGRDWFVYDLTAWPAAHSYRAGVVVHKTNTEMIVAASDGLVCLRYFSPAPTPN